MAVSHKLKELARQDTIGMTDTQVIEATGLGFATWRKMLDGHVPSVKTILQYCTGLNISPEPYLAARSEVTGKIASHEDIMIAALELSPLQVDDKRAVMREYISRLAHLDGSNHRAA